MVTWHEAHDRAFRALSTLLAERTPIVLPLPSLLEAHAILTRLPSEHRLAPADAADLLRGSLEDRCHLVSVPTQRGWTLLDQMVTGSLAGSAVFDAAVLECARAGGADRVFTLQPAELGAARPADDEEAGPSPLPVLPP